ncbi:MAG: NUDIX hydrolase [Candidatus Pacebacteria bacterium]|jgi:8-oxo-dGTP diphosphatase|nr:NUDIX hydrolase [Candidatus Moranbacteria bacterium]MBP9058665.1 NUDIX hydrolase [Candidatus Paceibacterota bacterium]MBP9801615.1 NUDIX hydrolase [Candidatus Moranbacteria bacterium]
MRGFLLVLWKKLNFSKHFQLHVIRLFQDQFLVGVTGLIFNEKDEVLLFKHTYRQRAWSLPGGYMNQKEHPKEALVREIKEESGFSVSIDWRMKVRTDRETARLDIAYIGTYIGGAFVSSEEVSEARFCSLQNLPSIRRDQLFLIESALRQRRHFYSTSTKAEHIVERGQIAHL